MRIGISGVPGAGKSTSIDVFGLPDIALFTGLMLKGVYEIALSYGFDYDDEEENPRAEQKHPFI